MNQPDQIAHDLLLLTVIIPLAQATLGRLDNVPKDFESATSTLKECAGLSLQKFRTPRGEVDSLKRLFGRFRKHVQRAFHTTYGPSKNSHETSWILESVCTERDSKIVLGLRAIAIAIVLATGSNEAARSVVKLMFGIIYRAEEHQDKVFAAYKSACNVIVNQITENSVEGVRNTFKTGSSEELIGIEINKAIDSNRESGKYEELDRFWMMAILSQTRILPAPGKHMTIEKTESFIRGLSHSFTDSDSLPDYDKWVPRSAYDKGIHDSRHKWSKKYYQSAMSLGKLVGTDIGAFLHSAATRSGNSFEVECHKRKSYHDSLTNSSSWEHTRDEGGKFATFYTSDGDFRKFLETGVNQLYEINEDDWYVDTVGHKICPSVNADYEFWRVAYLDKPLSGSFGEIITPGYLESGEEAFANGVDSRLGTLLFEWARHCHANWMKQYNPEDKNTYPKGKVSIVKEPGVKIRPVTSGQTWLNVFLSPAGHTLRKLLEVVPACRVGLGDTNNLYRLSEDMKDHGQKIKESDQISSSDMTSATDRIAHEVAFGILNGMVNSLYSNKVINKSEKSYLKQAAALLTTPKLLHLQCKGKELKVLDKMIFDGLIPEGEVLREQVKGKRAKSTVTFINRRGVMMGDPLTKIVLTSCSYAAWKMTTLSEVDNFLEFIYPKDKTHCKSSVHTFACAGDDHIGIGSKKDLMRIPKVMETMSFEISWEKYNINKSFVSYCQHYGMLHSNAIKRERANQLMDWEVQFYLEKGKVFDMKTDGWILRKEAPHLAKSDHFIHIDAPKLRCCTQFQKMGGSENFDKPDPLVGKARMLSKDTEYMRETLLLETAMKENLELSRYFQRLKHFISSQAMFVRVLMPSWMEWKVFKDPLLYLDPKYGGLGLAVPGGLDIKDYKPAEEIARSLAYMQQNPKWSDSATSWERGVTVTNVLINRFIKDGHLEGVKLEKEVRQEALETLSALSGTDAIGQKAQWSWIDSEYTCVDKEIPLVTSKENVYVELAIHPKKPQVAKKTRCRQLFASMRSRCKKVVVPDDYDFSWNDDPRPKKRYIKTASLVKAFDTNFVRPSLRIELRVLDVRGSEYGPTFIQNVEEVREKTEPGSFKLELDESLNLSRTSSSHMWD
jgi:hypothetical protein